MKTKILIVDDEHDIVELLEDLLLHKGYNIARAFSQAEARDQIEKFKPTIILLDIKLPDGDGVEFLKEIKVDHANIDIIMITGLADKEIALKALKNGAADYITKPIDLNYLTNSVLAKVVSGFSGDL
ncbi:MAG: response regulator [Candidatus Marinimicrobia bacterium]|nr:response regulator [Candidatus Neomarinimicrobiota bacterium]